MLQKHALHREVIGSNRAAIAIEDRLSGGIVINPSSFTLGMFEG
jgi:hypothetical protein